MFVNLYIARPTYYFILVYNCGLTVVIKRICYVMLYVSIFSEISVKLSIGDLTTGLAFIIIIIINRFV